MGKASLSIHSITTYIFFLWANGVQGEPASLHLESVLLVVVN